MFSFGYSFFLSGPIIGYTSLSYFYIFSIVFYMIHYFDTIAKHPFLVALQMHPYQCSSLQYPPRIDKPAPSLIHLRKAMSRICGITIPAKNTHRKNTDRMLTIQIKLILYLTLIGRLCRSVLY